MQKSIVRVVISSMFGRISRLIHNFMSAPGRGEPFQAMVKSGIKQMPAFDLTDDEIHKLAEFLRATDLSGRADPRAFKTNNIGMIEQDEYK